MLVKEIKELRNIIKEYKRQGFTIGFVPTMGALHEGHQSLIKRAAKENDKVIVSVFVNPTQFGPTEDYDAYPRNIEKDLETAKEAGACIVFNPEPSEMYFENKSTSVSGAKRPGHFDGVCLVVSKLFNIVTPDKAYFGQKDAQQVAVLKRMIRDLNFDVEIVECPIIREEDGLAKSSRNTYLSIDERKSALVLSRSLKLAKEALMSGERDVQKIKEIIRNELNLDPLARIDYVEVVDAESLEDVNTIENKILIPIAVYIGKTRLIDNLIF